jgi:hypothetical protein
MKRRLRALIGTLLPIGILIACSEAPEPVDEAGLLRFIPADTPYAFVSGRRLPEGLRERLADHVARQLSVQRAALMQVRTQFEESDDASDMPVEIDRAFGIADALLAEFEGRTTAAALREVGIEPAPLAAYYGIGPLPAARIELADAAAFAALLDRVEQKAGVAAVRGELSGQAYRRIDLGQVDAVLAVMPEHLIIGLLPDTLFERDLPMLLGHKPPAKSLAEDPVIAGIAERYGFEGFGEGFIRLDLLVDSLLGQTRGRNAEVMQALGAETVPLTPACLRLTRDLVAGMPRMVLGIAEAEADRLAVRGIWESSEAVASYLRRLAAPVPGVGAEYRGLVSVGLGVDLPQLRNGIEALLREVIDRGSECEWIDPAALEAAIPQLSLVLGPMTAGLKGFNLQIGRIDIDPETLQPATVDASLLAAVDDPRGVLALGAMLDPALGAVEVPTDGTPVDLPAAAIKDRPTPSLKVAIRGKTLLLMAGAAAADSQALFSAPVADPAPLFAVDYGVAQLADILGNVFEHAGARLVDEGEVELAAQLRDQLADFRLQAQLFERLRVVVYASAEGLVMDQEMQLR